MKNTYILLRALDRPLSFGFITTNVPGQDQTKLWDDTVAYEILGYADSVGEAQVKLFGRSYTLLKD